LGCVGCPANSVSPVASTLVTVTDCICIPGWTGMGANCSGCVAGKYKQNNGSVACTLCAAGKYSSSLNESTYTCNVCAAGSYPAGHRSKCLFCPAHSYSDAKSYNITACICDPGWTGTDGACTGCVSGKYKAMPGSAPCTGCVSGSYSAENTSQCVLCPTGSYSAFMSVSVAACACNAGWSGVNGICVVCADGNDDDCFYYFQK